MRYEVSVCGLEGKWYGIIRELDYNYNATDVARLGPYPTDQQAADSAEQYCQQVLGLKQGCHLGPILSGQIGCAK